LVRLLPEMLVRCLNWLLIHLFYRIRAFNRENVPESGGALLVANHVSFIDAQLIMALLDRPVRFLMYRPIYEHPMVNPVAKLNGALAIAGSDGKERIEATLKKAARLISEGELVGIFAEGKVTRTGELAEFRTGMETIMSHVKAPIVPICLKGLWGSIFSYEAGKPLSRWPKKIPYPVTIQFGKPLAPNTSAEKIRQIILDMHNEKDLEKDSD
jgi:acyl-[acyl-carrier-protein]-phospholipid O-acyltransferase/long-chain-fatty-acid--[acyl-carrier-protein] ligase